MRQSTSKYRNYLYDVGDLLKTRALEAREERSRTLFDSPEYHLESGRLIAFYEVISLLQQEAEGFGIALRELRLDDIDPDRDLT